MISRMFGASLGGTTRAGQYGVDCAAFLSILPSNFCGGGGSCCPPIVVVASGEPGVPVVCWAWDGMGAAHTKPEDKTNANAAFRLVLRATPYIVSIATSRDEIRGRRPGSLS